MKKEGQIYKIMNIYKCISTMDVREKIHIYIYIYILVCILYGRTLIIKEETI